MMNPGKCRGNLPSLTYLGTETNFSKPLVSFCNKCLIGQIQCLAVLFKTEIFIFFSGPHCPKLPCAHSLFFLVIQKSCFSIKPALTSER